MIRFSLRQFRTQGAVAAVGLVALVVVVLASGPHLAALYSRTLGTCRTRGDCPYAKVQFLSNDMALRNWLGILVIVVPGVVGVFWGAPLVARELESGTFRLAWTQSVTRTRWFAVKVGLAAVAAMAAAGLASLAVSFWASPLDDAAGNAFGTFDMRGIVPIGYGAFALALGVLAGVVVRRSLPAMAVTLAVFVGIRLAFAKLVRAHLLSPVHKRVALSLSSAGYGSTNGGPTTILPNPPNGLKKAWVFSSNIMSSRGQAITPSVVSHACPGLAASLNAPASGAGSGVAGGSAHPVRAPAGAQQALSDCLTKLSATYHEVVVYQPANRYWPLQSFELAIYLAAALLVCAGAWWWLRRRLV
jgi:hypothetical protein